MRSWLDETFASLREPGYRTLWYGTTASFAGLWASIVSRSFLAFDITESAAALSLIFLGFGIPMLLLSPVGGILADRLSRKRVMVASQWMFAIIWAAQALLIFGDLVNIWVLFGGSLAEGAVVALGIPARQALIGDLVEDDDLGNAIALQQVSFNAVRVVAPAAAGALIAVSFFGVGGMFALQAALFGLGALIFMRVPAPPPRESVSSTSLVSDTIEGLRYIHSRPALLVLVVTSLVVGLTVFPYGIFIAALVADVFELGSVAFGLLTATIAIGGLSASLYVASIADRASAWAVHTGVAAVFGLILVAFAVAPVFPAALVIGVAIGAAEVAFIGLNQALAMKYTHEDYYGRLQAVMLFGFALNGLIGFPIGLLADAIGVRETMVLQGVAGTLAVGAVLLYSRRIDARADAVELPDAKAAAVEIEHAVGPIVAS
jgi:predicted MFS family arabinose efflux permease